MAGYVRKGASVPAAAPATSGGYNKGGYTKPSGGAKTPPSKAKNRPSHDIVLVDEEGEIVKEMIQTDEGDREVSKRVGAIWTNEKGGMFIKFNANIPEGSIAKAFVVQQKN